MNIKELINNINESEYQELFGVKKDIFEKMVNILQKKFDEEHSRGGRPPKLSVLDKLVITLIYFREYCTMKYLAFSCNVSKSTISESIDWVEKTLIRSKQFNLPSKRKFLENLQNDSAIIDVTECTIERPKKNNAVTIQERKRNIPSRYKLL